MGNKKSWEELTEGQQTGVIMLGLVQLLLITAAQIDISRRSAEQLRGPKWMWRLISLVNFVGPLGYFIFGKKKASELAQ